MLVLVLVIVLVLVLVIVIVIVIVIVLVLVIVLVTVASDKSSRQDSNVSLDWSFATMAFPWATSSPATNH